MCFIPFFPASFVLTFSVPRCWRLSPGLPTLYFTGNTPGCTHTFVCVHSSKRVVNELCFLTTCCIHFFFFFVPFFVPLFGCMLLYFYMSTYAHTHTRTHTPSPSGEIGWTLKCQGRTQSAKTITLFRGQSSNKS